MKKYLFREDLKNLIILISNGYNQQVLIACGFYLILIIPKRINKKLPLTRKNRIRVQFSKTYIGLSFSINFQPPAIEDRTPRPST